MLPLELLLEGELLSQLALVRFTLRVNVAVELEVEVEDRVEHGPDKA